MNVLFGWFRLYGEIAISLSLLSILIFFIERFISKEIRVLSLLRLCYLLFAVSLLLPCAFSQLPETALLRPSVQVFSGAAKLKSENVFSGVVRAQSRASSLDRRYLDIDKRWMAVTAMASFSLLIFSFMRLFLRIYDLYHRLNALPLLRKQNKVRVLVSSEGCVPYAALGLWRRYIVLPHSFLLCPEKLRMGFRHESAHLRHGDIFFIWITEILEVLYFWNPLVRQLCRRIQRFQEFACDEYVVGHHRYSPRAYGSCLLEAAQWAVTSNARLGGTTCMAWEGDGLELKRRIQMLLNRKMGTAKAVPKFLVVLFVAVLAGCSFFTRSTVQERKLSRADASRYAQIAAQSSIVPIDMNDLVYERLNKFVSTGEGRKWVTDAFGRLPEYRSMIQTTFAEHQAPEDLMALALYESGMRNDLISSHKAAGIWQFIPATARRYNLVVNADLDERTIPQKETVAAARYLKDLHSLFGDWRLAVKAYNEGENRVSALIKTHGTRDPWQLERNTSTENYLSGAIAMLILYRNPELVASL